MTKTDHIMRLMSIRIVSDLLMMIDLLGVRVESGVQPSKRKCHDLVCDLSRLEFSHRRRFQSPVVAVERH